MREEPLVRGFPAEEVRFGGITVCDLKGKTALVTGGSRGLGRAIVLELAGAGADIAFCYRKDAAAAGAVAADVERLTHRRPLAVQADITGDADRKRLVAEVAERRGHIDVLVNNAGTKKDGLAVQVGAEWDEVLGLDLTAPFRLSQLVLKHMIKRSWGRIINIGSVGARIGFSGQAGYTAAKAGLEGLTRALASEYGRKGITVNTVSPGLVETDLTRDVSAYAREYMEKYAALRRLVTPEAVASVVAFLASDRAWAITGQTVHVDCGLVKI